MKYVPEKHHRRSIRLEGYDYSLPGGYFVTIVTCGRECLFGEIVDGKMVLNDYGRIVRDEWEKSAIIRREVELGIYIIMPNHFHAIVIIHDSDIPAVGATGRSPLRSAQGPNGPKPKSLGALMAGFKASVTKEINILRDTPGASVWQRNYHDHIIRNDDDYNRIYQYIESNPEKWADDDENPSKFR